MREILFRGKKRSNGEWEYGSLELGQFSEPLICCDDYAFTQHYVDPDTVGQWTGLRDRNGKQIFEGDIIRHFNDKLAPRSYVIGKVYFDSHRASFMRNEMGTTEQFRLADDCIYEVIGNIYDSPEMFQDEQRSLEGELVKGGKHEGH